MMQVNYEDERFDAVKEEEKEALSEVEQTYGDMVGKTNDLYKEQISGVDKFTQEQQQFQQEQTDFAIEQLQQQKDKAQKDYIKEQSAAYTDFKKQSGQYSTAAEQMAAAGLAGSGFSESSQVAMWNAYQSRVTTARESFTQAVVDYDNAMKDARLQGSAAMAEIALQGFQQKLELTLQGFQYENQLIQQMLGQKQQVQDRYYGRWQDVLAQLNQEAAMAEEQRQFNESMAFQQKEHEEGVRQFNEELAEQQRQFNEQMALKQVKPGSGDSTATDQGNEALIEEPQGPQEPQEPQSVQPPNSIEGHGKLVTLADMAEIEVYQDGKWITLEQPVRKAEDGTLWVWDPTQNKYIKAGKDESWANTDKVGLSSKSGGLTGLSKYGEVQNR